MCVAPSHYLFSLTLTVFLLISFISAIALRETTALAGSLRSSGDGPKTGLSVSTSRQERGSCFTSFCFCLERTIDGGIEKKNPASTAGSAVDALPSNA